MAGGGIVVGSVGRGPVRFAKSHWAGFPLLFNNKINEWKFIVFVRKCPHCCFSMSFNLFFNSLKTNIPYPLICIQWTGVWIERHINFIQLNIQLNFLFLAVYLYATKSYILENSHTFGFPTITEKQICKIITFQISFINSSLHCSYITCIVISLLSINWQVQNIVL